MGPDDASDFEEHAHLPLSLLGRYPLVMTGGYRPRTPEGENPAHWVSGIPGTTKALVRTTNQQGRWSDVYYLLDWATGDAGKAHRRLYQWGALTIFALALALGAIALASSSRLV